MYPAKNARLKKVKEIYLIIIGIMHLFKRENGRRDEILF